MAPSTEASSPPQQRMGAHPAHAAEGNLDAWSFSGNQYASPGALAGMAAHPDLIVRCHVAVHRTTPPDVLATLSDDVREVRIALASNPETPHTILDALLGDESPYVRGRVVENPALGESTMRLIMAGDPPADVKRSLAANESAPGHILDTLSGDADTLTREAAAANTSTPGPVLQRLTGDRSVDVVAAAAGNPNTPVEVLRAHRIWARDPQIMCRLAANPSCPPSVLSEIDDLEDDLSFELAANPSSPPALLDNIVLDPTTPARLSCIANESVKSTTLAAIAKRADDLSGRKLAAGHRNTPMDTLLDLRDDPDEGVRLCLAENTSAPHDALAALAFDPSELVRSAVARNPVTDQDVLDSLACDANPYVRFQVASNPVIAEKTARRLAADADQTMRHAVLRVSPHAERIISEPAGGMFL